MAEEKTCERCVFWGPDSGFSDEYTDSCKLCRKWFNSDKTPIMKITYGGGKGAIFTPIGFCCKFFRDKKDCPIMEIQECFLCDNKECPENAYYEASVKNKL